MSITSTKFVAGASGARIVNNGYAGVNLTFSGLKGSNWVSGDKVVLVFASGDITLLGGGTVEPTFTGLTLTKVVGSAGDVPSSGAIIYYADVSGSTTDSVTLTNPGNYDKISIGGWTLAGAASGTASNTANQQYGQQADPQTLSLTVPAGGVGFPALCSFSAIITPTGQGPVWANATADLDLVLASLAELPTAHTTTTGSVSCQCSGSGGNTFSFIAGMIGASWGAASTFTWSETSGSSLVLPTKHWVKEVVGY